MTLSCLRGNLFTLLALRSGLHPLLRNPTMGWHVTICSPHFCKPLQYMARTLDQWCTTSLNDYSQFVFNFLLSLRNFVNILIFTLQCLCLLLHNTTCFGLTGHHELRICSKTGRCSITLSRVWVTIDGVWISDWIYWPLTDCNYKNTITNHHTLKITTAHANPSQSAFTSRFPVMDLNNRDSSVSVLG
jgi:hypothetical protein